MEIREARPDDADGIASVASASLGASYDFLDGDTVETAVEEWYAPDRFSETVGQESAVWYVAVDDGRVRGFVQAAVVHGDAVVGEVDWLHVAPDARGQGLAVQLLGAVLEAIEKQNAVLVRGLVLSENEDGASFYEAHGFERVGERTVDIGDEQYEEAVYERRLDEGHEELVDTVRGPDGDLYVDYTRGERGVESAFYPTFRDDSLDAQYGWYCSNCGATETTMDSMGRIACGDCDNYRKSTRWDGSYL